VPCRKLEAVPRYDAGFYQQLASPLRPSLLEDWCLSRAPQPPTGAHERFDQAVRAPRFQALYRAWAERGEPVLDATLSTTLADAIARTTGRLECHVLTHRYVHLFPLVGTA
jgi:hypothetical protein